MKSLPQLFMLLHIGKIITNSTESYLKPHSEASDQSLHCLPRSLYARLSVNRLK